MVGLRRGITWKNDDAPLDHQSGSGKQALLDCVFPLLKHQRAVARASRQILEHRVDDERERAAEGAVVDLQAAAGSVGRRGLGLGGEVQLGVLARLCAAARCLHVGGK